MRRAIGSKPGDEAVRSLQRALLAIVSVILLGTCGFMLIEGWDFWHSLFFTLITITTVGYGDYGLSESGERFTCLLLVGGIGVATYSASQVIESAIEYNAHRSRRMLRRIQHLTDHYIVCGLGRIGRTVCEHLIRHDIPHVAVDTNAAVIESAVAAGHLAIVGDASEDEVLEQLGIRRARGVVCLTSSDAENIVITLSARGLKPDITVISRVEHASNVAKNERAGATKVVSPAGAGALRIAQAIMHPELADFMDQDPDQTDGFSLAQFRILESSKLDGKKVGDYDYGHGSLVFVALSREGEPAPQRPNPDDVLAAGDTLIVAGGAEDLAGVARDARMTAKTAA